MGLEFDNLGGLFLVAIILLVLVPVAFFIFDAFFSDNSDVTIATKNGLKRLAITLEDDQVGRAESIPLALDGAYVVGKQAESNEVYLEDGGVIIIDNKECKGKVCLCAFASKDDLLEKDPGVCIPLNSYECVYATSRADTEGVVYDTSTAKLLNIGKAHPIAGFSESEYAVFTGDSKNLQIGIINTNKCPGKGVIFTDVNT